MKNSNPHFGSSLEDFLEAEGFLESATQQAIADAAVWHRQRRWLQAACWVVGVALGLAAGGAVILATFAQLGVFQ